MQTDYLKVLSSPFAAYLPVFLQIVHFLLVKECTILASMCIMVNEALVYSLNMAVILVAIEAFESERSGALQGFLDLYSSLQILLGFEKLPYSNVNHSDI